MLVTRYLEYLGYADLSDITRGNELVIIGGDEEFGLLESAHQARDGDSRYT